MYMKPDGVSKQTSGAYRRELLARGLYNQNYRCYWCGCQFYDVVKRGIKLIVLVPQFEHIIPRSVKKSMKLEGMCLSCQVCNMLKGSYVGKNEEDIRRYVMEKRYQRGIVLAPVIREEFHRQGPTNPT